MSRRAIQGSRAIVTGASSGIGREVARELARQGARVVITARREDRLRELAGQIAAEGGRVEWVAGDITDPEVRAKTIQTAADCFGGLDVLVNNAGVGATALFRDADPTRVRRVMEVNFFALVEMTRLALPLLAKGNRPIVVNVASILGHRGVPNRSERRLNEQLADFHPPAQRVVTHVHRGAIEPGLDRRFVHLAEVFIEPQEDLLCGVLGVFPAAHHAPGRSQDQALVQPHQTFQRGLLRLGAPHQLAADTYERHSQDNTPGWTGTLK